MVSRIDEFIKNAGIGRASLAYFHHYPASSLFYSSGINPRALIATKRDRSNGVTRKERECVCVYMCVCARSMGAQSEYRIALVDSN